LNETTTAAVVRNIKKGVHENESGAAFEKLVYVHANKEG
jgi:hypothetical protein